LLSTLFTFTDSDGGTLDAVQIISLPEYGTIELGGVEIEAGTILEVPADFTTGVVYLTDPTQQGAYTDYMQFRVRTAETGVFSDVGLITINVTLCTNTKPDADDNTENIDRTVTASCLVATEYTDGAIFTFTDAEGDPLEVVKIMSLPQYGTLRIGESTEVQVGDIIDFTESLFYITDSSTTDAYLDTVQFQVRTENNGEFSDTATLTFDVTACTNINNPPESADVNTTINRIDTQTCLIENAYTESIFSFTDAEDDELNAVKIVSLPANQGNYVDTIEFQVRTNENTEFSNTSTWTITVTQCIDAATPCVDFEPYFDLYSGGLGLLEVGNLVSDTAVIGDYKIEWRLGSTSGETKLVTGSSYSIEGVQHIHPFDQPIPLAAGIYYPVLI
jgi:hypothetical protein